jgi:hypothetical protein
VPDPQAQSSWQTFIAQTRTASRDCDGAVATSNGDLLTAAARGIDNAAAAADSVQVRILVVERAGAG